MKISIDKILIYILIVIIPILYTNRTLDPSQHIQYFALSVCLFVFFVFQFIQKRKLSIPNKSTYIFICANILLIIYSVISLLISKNQPDAIFVFSKYILFFILMLAILYFQNPQQLFLIVIKATIVLSFLILLPGYWQLIELLKEGELIIPNGTYNIRSVFAHRNLFSEILVLILPISAFAYFLENKYWKYFGIVSYNLALTMIIVLSNRASWLALSLYAAITFTYFLVQRKGFFAERRKSVFLINSVVIVTICVLFFNTFSDTSSLKSHTANSIEVHKGSVKDRIELWERTLKLISENPVLGNGLGSWKIEILKYGNSGLVSENNTTFYQRPHNDFLWVAAEQGILGGGLYSLLFAIMLIILIHQIINAKGEQKRQSITIFSITLSFLIFSLLSFPKERIPHNTILFVVWGIQLTGLNSNLKENSQFTFRYLNSILIVLLLFFAVIGYNRINGEIHTKNAILAKKEGNFKECISEIEQGNSIFYKIDETSTPLSWYAGNASFQLGDFKKANEYFTDALKYNPNHIYALNDYAGCLVKYNHIDEAVKYYKKAIKIAPNFDEAKLNLCAIYFNKNDLDLAFELLKTIDAENTSDRYEKTVRIILQKIIENHLRTGNIDKVFEEKYDLNKNNYHFYKELLLKSIKQNSNANAILYLCK